MSVYVLDRCVNFYNGTLAEGPSIVYSCFYLCAETVFSSDAHSRRSATIHASPNLVYPSAHLSLCTILTHEQLVCPSVLID